MNVEEWTRQLEARRAEVLTLPVIKTRHHARILPPQQGDVRVSVSVGPAGEVVALWSPQGDQAAPTSMTVHAPDPTIAAHLPSLPVAHPSVQPLPDGRVLVVGARCRWRPEGPDRNAVVYDDTGAVLAEHTLGDGIEHVRTTHRGEVWVGYFDEGVFGNYGWGDPDSEPPIGSSGLTRFTADFVQEWNFPSDGPWDAISDCYALNVDGDTTWACYYMDFPVVRIEDGTVTGWHNEVEGAKAIAVGGSRIAFYGGYGPDSDRLVVGELGDDRVHVVGEHRLVLPDGQPLPATAQVVGRGADLHVLVEDSWLRLGVEDLL